MIKLIIKDSFAYLVSKSLVAVINIGLIYFLLDVYGAEEYSKYTILFILSLCISNLTSTWFSQSYLREREEVTQDFLIFSLVVVFLLICSLCFFVNLFEHDFFLNLVSFIVLTVSQSVYLIGRTLLQKDRQIKKFFIYDLIRMILILISCIVFSIKSVSYEGIIYSYLLGNFIFIFVFFSHINQTKVILSRNIYIQFLSWFKFGFPVALWLTIASLQMLIDRYLMSLFFNQEVSGYYSSYYDLILKICALFIIPISNAIYPILVQNESEFTSYKPLALNLSLISFFLSLFISITSYFVIDSQFFNYYIKLEFDSFLVSIMIFAISLWQLALIFQKPLEMEKKTHVMVFNIFICVFLSSLINVLFVDYFGVHVFAYSLSASAILYLVLTFVSVNK